jgi:1-acyl-sn-glycerol-3-phosphate acyltransferase
MAIGSALHSAARYAMLPAIAQDIGSPLTRVMGWVELGGVSAIIVAAILGFQVEGELRPGLPRVVVILLGLSLFALVTAFLCSFPSDVRRPERPGQALVGFFRDCRRIFMDHEARYGLLALAAFQGVVTAAAGPIFTLALNNDVASHDDALFALILVTGGVALGCGLASLQGNIRRSLGLVSLGLTGLAIAQAWVALANDQGIAPAAPSLLLGLMSGLVIVPLRATYQAAVPADARGNAMSVMNTVIYLMTIAVALLVYGLILCGVLADIQAQLWFLVLVLLLGAVLAWRVLLPQTLELVIELLILPMHRIHVRGPGVGQVPRRGPLLMLGNHTTYFDPFWIAKLAPRHVRPLMTSTFFDLPVIHWLMTRVVRAIRVPRVGFRRQAPELEEVIAELKRGGCVLLFPESILRRTEERLLRQFGQGVWRVLRELPQTPVIVFWIEGGWGSYASYRNGSPMKNKPLDFLRRIDIALESPQLLPSEVLADQRSTRQFLMRACLGARRHLGLDVPQDALPSQEDMIDEEENERVRE